MELKNWLQKKCSTHSPMTNEYVVRLMFDEIVRWYSGIDELELVHNEEKLLYKFFMFASFGKYTSHTSMGSEELDYFDTKYSDDITDLFIKCKDISRSCCADIFEKGTTAYDLLLFLSDDIEVVDEIIPEDETPREDYY